MRYRSILSVVRLANHSSGLQEAGHSFRGCSWTRLEILHRPARCCENQTPITDSFAVRSIVASWCHWPYLQGHFVNFANHCRSGRPHRTMERKHSSGVAICVLWRRAIYVLSKHHTVASRAALSTSSLSRVFHKWGGRRSHCHHPYISTRSPPNSVCGAGH